MTFSLELPRHYRSDEILAFHARDPLAVCERVEKNRIFKGFMIHGTPVALEIMVTNGRAECRTAPDGFPPDASPALFQDIARRLLGLGIDPSLFERTAKKDALLGPLIQKQRGLRIPQTVTPFEALTWAIIGQQINLSFAITLRRTLIQLAGQQHSSGLWCHPDASRLARLAVEQLTTRKFSRSKAETLIRVATLVESGQLPLDQWKNSAREEIEAGLLAIKGIGPWTANYTLLRGFGCADCSLHGDAGIKAALRRLAGNTTGPEKKEIEAILERYKPHRSLAAAHLWASLRTGGE